LRSPIEEFWFPTGQPHHVRGYSFDDLPMRSTPQNGSSDADLLVGGWSDDNLQGGEGDDAIYASRGHDTLYGDGGRDVLFAGEGNDRLFGGDGADDLRGEAGNDELQAGDGDDFLLDLQGNNVLVGGHGHDIAKSGAGNDRVDLGDGNDMAEAGAGGDTISVGDGDDWVAAGHGADVIDLGSGRNLLAFNRGDGSDTVTGSGTGGVLSLGGGIRYEDITLSRWGDDLRVELGWSESLRVAGWYGSNPSRLFDTLQVVTVLGDHDSGSDDPLRDDKVEVFDFGKLVERFDREWNRRYVSSWSVMNDLLDAHLGGGDASAFGGDLSYHYHTNSGLSGILQAIAEWAVRRDGRPAIDFGMTAAQAQVYLGLNPAGGLSGMSLDAAQNTMALGAAEWQTLRPRSEVFDPGAVVSLA
jgi:hypothetical protein